MTKKTQTLMLVSISVVAAIAMVVASFSVASGSELLTTLGSITAAWFVPFTFIGLTKCAENTG